MGRLKSNLKFENQEGKRMVDVSSRPTLLISPEKKVQIAHLHNV